MVITYLFVVFCNPYMGKAIAKYSLIAFEVSGLAS